MDLDTLTSGVEDVNDAAEEEATYTAAALAKHVAKIKKRGSKWVKEEMWTYDRTQEVEVKYVEEIETWASIWANGEVRNEDILHKATAKHAASISAREAKEKALLEELGLDAVEKAEMARLVRVADIYIFGYADRWEDSRERVDRMDGVDGIHGVDAVDSWLLRWMIERTREHRREERAYNVVRNMAIDAESGERQAAEAAEAAYLQRLQNILPWGVGPTRSGGHACLKRRNTPLAPPSPQQTRPRGFRVVFLEEKRFVQ
jgi:hypothetical protein